MPKISVIIPVYNTEKYLRQCLDSVINQTLKDIEIICINDGSTDNSLRILEEYAKSDTRINIINQKNHGQGYARNKGLEITSGEYIAFLDSDDFVDVEAFESLYTYAKKYNADFVEFLINNYNNNSDADGLFHTDYKFNENQIYTNVELNKYIFSVPILACNKIYKKDFINKHNIHFSCGKLGEDHIFTIKSRLLAERICFMNKAFYFYRINSDSITHKKSIKTIGIFKIMQKIEKYLKNNNYLNQLSEEFEAYKYNFTLWNIDNVPIFLIPIFLNLAKKQLLPEQITSFNDYNKQFNQSIFSVKNSPNKTHKVITICGIKIKFKRKQHV